MILTLLSVFNMNLTYQILHQFTTLQLMIGQSLSIFNKKKDKEKIKREQTVLSMKLKTIWAHINVKRTSNVEVKDIVTKKQLPVREMITVIIETLSNSFLSELK